MMHKRRKSLAASEKGRKMARARWAADRARRDAEEAARVREMEIARIRGEGPVHDRQYVGTLQWHGADGRVRRWTVRRGPRSGQIRIDGIEHPKTTTWLLDRLRRHLSALFRTGRGY